MLQLLLSIGVAFGADPKAIHKTLDDESGWALHAAENAEGVTVYKKSVPSLGLEAFKGVLILDASVDVDAVYELVADLENHDKHSKHLHESTLIEAEGKQDWFFEVAKSPGPFISERYWFNTTITTKDVGGNDGHHKRAWSSFDAAAKYPDVVTDLQTRYPDAVLVALTYGSWEWEPLADGTTRMTYRTVTHPGGNVPAGMYATVSGKTLPDNMMTFVRPAL